MVVCFGYNTLYTLILYNLHMCAGKIYKDIEKNRCICVIYNFDFRKEIKIWQMKRNPLKENRMVKTLQ
jgi:hypothetical protein